MSLSSHLWETVPFLLLLVVMWAGKLGEKKWTNNIHTWSSATVSSLLFFPGWGLFNTWPPLSLTSITRMRLLPVRHSVSGTFRSTFPLLQEFASLPSEILHVVPHPDDVLGSQRNSTVRVKYSRADLKPGCPAPPLPIFSICEMGLVRDSTPRATVKIKWANIGKVLKVVADTVSVSSYYWECSGSGRGKCEFGTFGLYSCHHCC